MRIQANTIRPGNVIEHEGKQCAVIKIDLILPGKGNAFIAVEMRDLRTGTKTQERWRTADTVERLETHERPCQFLYAEEDRYTFMDNETYDQFVLDGSTVGGQGAFLQNDIEVKVMTVDGTPVGLEMPSRVTMEVVEAEPVVKGQTASSSYKPALLENGVRVMVPPHIRVGARIVVNPNDQSYVERAKG